MCKKFHIKVNLKLKVSICAEAEQRAAPAAGDSSSELQAPHDLLRDAPAHQRQRRHDPHFPANLGSQRVADLLAGQQRQLLGLRGPAAAGLRRARRDVIAEPRRREQGGVDGERPGERRPSAHER